MQTATLIHGTVKYAVDRIRETKNGQRVKAVITADSGEDIELWDYPGKTVHALKKGEKVALTHDGKRYLLIATSPQNGNGHQAAKPTAYEQARDKVVPHPSVQPEAVAPESPDVQEWFCIFLELRAAMPDCSEHTWRAAASTLFMARMKARCEEF